MKNLVRRTLPSMVALACVLCIWTASGGNALAQGGGWQFRTDVEAEVEYNTNVYHLSPAQESRLERNSPENQASGRFKDMESVSDFIVTPAVKFTAKGSGLGGKDFLVRPHARYKQYTLNQKKSHFELGVGFRHDAGADGTVGLDLSYAPGVFSKNYLASVTNWVGPVLLDERIYLPGTHDDAAVEVFYRRRMFKGKERKMLHPSVKKAYGEFLLGYENRKYDAPFEKRDSDSFKAGAGLDLELRNKTDVSVSYIFETISTPVETEVLIRNEPDFGVDFNGDTDTVDLDVASLQNVDRSRNEHTFAVKGAIMLDDNWLGKARYELRIQNYKSNEPFDVTRVDRTDIRHRIGLGVERELAPNLTLGLDWLWTSENAGRDALAAIDPTESKSYSVHQLSAVLAYRM